MLTMRDILDQRHIKKCSYIPLYNEEVLSYAERHSSTFRILLSNYKKEFSVFPKIDTKIGIEIECEQITSPNPLSWDHNLWFFKGDGSLRNGGLEFISPALLPNQLQSALSFILAWLQWQQPKADFSWRTSIHVHLECIDLPIEKFKSLLLLYFIFEDSLFQFANPGRKETNIFCTPINRANFYALNNFINSTDSTYIRAYFTELNQYIRKYSALNLNHMYDFGTIEFRHLRGTNNPKILNVWLHLLLALFQAAIDIPQKELFESISNLNTTSAYDAFTEKVFGEELSAALFSPMHSHFLSHGVSLTKEVVYGQDFLQTIKCSPSGGLVKFLNLKEKQRRKDRLATKKRETVLNSF